MIEKSIQLRIGKIELFKSGIIQIQCDDDIIVEIEDRYEIIEAIEELAGGVKRQLLIITGARNQLTSEARNLDLDRKIERFVLREALVITSLSTRLAAMIYYKFRKPQFVKKVFSKRDDALQWLNDLQMESDNSSTGT